MTDSRSVSVALGIAARSLRKLRNQPPRALPPLLIPLFFFTAFAGALSALGSTSGFGYYNFTAFIFVFVLYMAAMFSGVFSAFEIAQDYESGMGNRLMLSAPRRMAIVAGYVIVALVRGVLAVALIWAVALATGMPVRGTVPEIAGLVALALLLNVVVTLYGAGIALRFQSIASSVLILIPVFMVLFVSPVFTPRDKLSGWLSVAADINPLTPAVEAGRGLLADNPVSVVLAFATAIALVIVFAAWAVRGMHKAEQGPGAGQSRRARIQAARARRHGP